MSELENYSYIQNVLLRFLSILNMFMVHDLNVFSTINKFENKKNRSIIT